MWTGKAREHRQQLTAKHKQRLHSHIQERSIVLHTYSNRKAHTLTTTHLHAHAETVRDYTMKHESSDILTHTLLQKRFAWCSTTIFSYNLLLIAVMDM